MSTFRSIEVDNNTLVVSKTLSLRQIVLYATENEYSIYDHHCVQIYYLFLVVEQK